MPTTKALEKKAPATKAKGAAIPLKKGSDAHVTPGRQSKYSGMTITTTRKDNPRRAGTFGHDSFEIILRHRGKVSFEQYRDEGGRLNDLQWDIDHDYVTVK
jgi:hypothetical protein